jgi:hypothetical protein
MMRFGGGDVGEVTEDGGGAPRAEELGEGEDDVAPTPRAEGRRSRVKMHLSRSPAFFRDFGCVS